MPPLPAINRTAKVTTAATIGQHTCQLGCHWQWGEGTATDADMLNLAEVWQGAWETNWWSNASEYVSSDCTVIYTQATDLSADDAATSTYVHSVPGNASQQCSANDAVLLRHAISARYRGGHPRTYLFGQTTDNIDVGGQTWISALTAAALAAWESAVAAVIASGDFPNIAELVVGTVSYLSGGARRVTPLWLPFNDTTTDSIIRSQRRRVRRTPTPT